MGGQLVLIYEDMTWDGVPLEKFSSLAVRIFWKEMMDIRNKQNRPPLGSVVSSGSSSHAFGVPSLRAGCCGHAGWLSACSPWKKRPLVIK